MAEGQGNSSALPGPERGRLRQKTEWSGGSSRLVAAARPTWQRLSIKRSIGLVSDGHQRLCAAGDSPVMLRPPREGVARCGSLQPAWSFLGARPQSNVQPAPPQQQSQYSRQLWPQRSRRQRRARPPAVAGSSAGSGGGVAPKSAVKVYEAGKQGSSRRVVAETVVQAPVDVVWRIIRSYEQLPDFVPNLESCERLPSPRSGRVWIRQRGCSQAVLWRLEAEAVLEVEEVQLPLGRREARFSMVDGDFKEINGRWVVEPDPSSAVGMATLLRFDISVQPQVSLPSSVVSYIVRAGLPANIQAVARKAEEIAARKLGASGLARWAGTEDDPPLPRQQAAGSPEAEQGQQAGDPASKPSLNKQQLAGDRDTGLPSKGPFWRLTGSGFPEAAPLTAYRQQRRQQGMLPEQEQADVRSPPEEADPQSLYLGVVSVPLPPAGNRSSSQAQTQDELNQRQGLKEMWQGAYPAFGLKRASSRAGSLFSNGSVPPAASLPGDSRALTSGAPEVHLRRLDTFDTLHRRAVAAITIEAPPQAVWEVLTDYNRLAEFIPNLAVSQRIALPPSAPPNVIRVRQVGYKRMLYMCLHAESVLDLIEKPQSEVQFRQVAGDFERFQGKWMLQPLPTTSTGSVSASTSSLDDAEASHTQLKYAVEIVIPRTTRMLGVLEPLLERAVFEDVPTNLAAIKQRVESTQAERNIHQLQLAGDSAAAAALQRKLERPSLAEMVEDFTVLAAELERCFGADQVLPARSDLREMNRSDLEKALSSHGGPTVVAQRLGWKLKGRGRRPKGYWDSPDNVRSEIDDFIEEQGLQPGAMPAKNDFVRAGRYDLARAVERWGGLYELASELGYAVTGSRRTGSSEWQEHISELAASTGLSGREGLFELAAKTYAARRNMQDAVEDVAADVALAAGADQLDGADSKPATGTTVAERPTLSGKPSGAFRAEIDAW